MAIVFVLRVASIHQACRARLLLLCCLGVAALLAPSACFAAGPKLGAYYYPWYGTYPGAHSVGQSLRAHLVPPQRPTIDNYDSRSADLIARHLDHSHLGNIRFWAVSWWGPHSAEDDTFLGAILKHPRRGELQYAIHYECPGRLGPLDAPDFANFASDFAYLAATYFNDPNYLRIEGRPVVFLYLTRVYFDSPQAAPAVAAMRAALLSQFKLRPYLIGDELFSSGVSLARAQLCDAITIYDVYGAALEYHGSTSAALAELADLYDAARKTLAGSGVAFVPAVTPGFNDTAVRSGHVPAPRYMQDDSHQMEGELLRRMLTHVALPRVDPRADNLLLVNSFNEWHEDTQIEPMLGAALTKRDDSPHERYTQGVFYEGYGNLYLTLVHDATMPSEPSLLMPLIVVALAVAAWVALRNRRGRA